MSVPITPSRCRSRMTSEKTIQRFGDKFHKFYLEQRCPRPAHEDEPTCLSCRVKYITEKRSQASPHFPHGTIDGPIPPESHLFGGPWYEEGVKKWGEPPASVLLCALRFQEEARQENHLPSKVVAHEPEEMVRTSTTVKKKEAAVSKEEDLPPKDPPAPVKKIRRPALRKQATEPLPPPSPPFAEDAKEEELPAPPPPKPPRTRAPRKKATSSSSSSLVPAPPVHQDSCIPTHYEESMEEKSLSDYETEIVPLTLFTLGEVVYFRDARKNKLYRRIKEKTLGPYLGRYDPVTDTLVTGIPDSDEE